MAVADEPPTKLVTIDWVSPAGEVRKLTTTSERALTLQQLPTDAVTTLRATRNGHLVRVIVVPVTPVQLALFDAVPA